ncbi:hypothetical protein VE03_06102 [Pseudogymnoascus sp. 23342-1-I1]|nr:hypothetical protein VE03_06102 [Pseudogymnoascus sp. 23342-1-I1]
MHTSNLCSLLTAAALAGLAAAQSKIKIMPLGDSITEITCWRTTLWDDLQSDGVTNSFEFVGSMTNNAQNCQGNAGWDMHHEGHSGYLAIDIANTNLQGWLASTKPDVVMFMLGTNDVAQGRSTADIIAAYTKMVGLMRASNANMKIIVDLVIPLGIGSTAPITALNAAIPSWASGLSTSTSPITIADTATGFTTADLRDGVHPNDSGDAKIAAALHPVLLSVIRSFGGGMSPPVSTGGATTTQTPVSTAPAQGQALYGQCGGQGWTGVTTCAVGTCRVANQWYSQCLN